VVEPRRCQWIASQINILALYNFWSINHLSPLVRHGNLRGELWRLGYGRLLSLVKRGADGVAIAPLVKLYSRPQVRTILGDFAQVDVSVAGLNSRFARRLPAAAHAWLEARWGWYVIAHATK
jgi:hypothetical protein